MPEIRELRDQQSQAAARITELANRINAERRDFHADELASWNAANADYDRLGREIQTAQRADQIRRDQNGGAGDPDVGRDNRDPRRRRDRVQATEEQRSLAFRAWTRSQMGMPLRRSEREACQALRFNPNAQQLTVGMWSDQHRGDVKSRMLGSAGDRRADLIRRESRNLSAQIGASGAYLVSPGTLSSALETNLLAFGGVRQVADEMTTTTGEPFFWPTVDDTANRGALLGENSQAISASVNPGFNLRRWDAYKFTSTPILVPTELLEDSQFDLPGYIGELLGVRLGRGTAPYYATGTGGSQPEGIVTGATVGVTTASATVITFDELINLQHSIDPAYRSMPGVGWLAHDLIWSYIRKIKDSQNRPLWTNGEFYASGIREGMPDKLLGWPVNVCQEMDSTVTTGKTTLLGGVLSRYKIRRVRDTRLYRLQERYRDLDQDGFVAFIREDGKLLQAGTPPVKAIRQA